MVYYVEYIFAENFIIDFMLLYVTGKLLNKIIIFKRLFIASLMAAAYAVAAVGSSWGFLRYFIVKFSISVLMLIISYDIKGIIGNLRMIICFYITSLFMVGIITGLYYVTLSKITVNVIIISVFMVYVLLSYLFKELKLKKEKYNYTRVLTISLMNRKKEIKAFIDTGNELKEPFTNKSVIIVYMDSIKNVLGNELYDSIMEFYSKEKSYEKMLQDHVDVNLKIVRFNTISSAGDMMVCIHADNINVKDNEGHSLDVDAVLGLYPRRISERSDCDALLFNKILEWELERNNELVKVC